MSTEFRTKENGRYIYKCRGCGVYIKIKTRFCRACVCDLLGGGTAGDWRDKQKIEAKIERTQRRAFVLLHPQPNFTFA